MTPIGWVALAAALALTLLPSVPVARAGVLAGAGRLAVDGGCAPPGRADRWFRQLPWQGVVGVLGATAVVAVGVRAGPLLAVAAGAVFAVGTVLGRDVLVRRAARLRHRDLLTAVRVLVGELDAGARPASALSAAAEAGSAHREAFLAAAGEAARGGDVGAVLADGPDAALAVVGLAWRLSDSTGSALAGVLGRVAGDLAAADDQQRVVAVALAGPRSSAFLLSGLPALGIALGTAMGARPVPFLIGHPAGRALCCVGVLLDVAGLLWMRRILRRAEAP